MHWSQGLFFGTTVYHLVLQFLASSIRVLVVSNGQVGKDGPKISFAPFNVYSLDPTRP